MEFIRIILLISGVAFWVIVIIALFSFAVDYFKKLSLCQKIKDWYWLANGGR